MQIEVVKSKIHRVTVTGADLNYIGSITIDEALMEASNIFEGEKVSIVNLNNGERLETYAITGPRNTGEITHAHCQEIKSKIGFVANLCDGVFPSIRS